MGPGIFTKYSKQVIGGIIAFFLLLAAVPLYLQFRGPVGKVSPYEEINAWGDEQVSISTERSVYGLQEEVVQVTIRNDSESGLVIPANYRPKEWVLETKIDGVWHTMRTTEKYIRWDFPSEDKTPNSGPSGIVKCGEEQRFLCWLGEAYRLPLDAGTYRIVFPDMEKETGASGTYRTVMAAEFEIVEEGAEE